MFSKCFIVFFFSFIIILLTKIEALSHFEKPASLALMWNAGPNENQDEYSRLWKGLYRKGTIYTTSDRTVYIHRKASKCFTLNAKQIL